MMTGRRGATKAGSARWRRTFATGTDWLPKRQRIVTLILALGALVFAALWYFESATGIISPSDRYAYPLVILLIAACLAAMFLWPRQQAWAELASFAIVAIYLLAQILYFVTEPSAGIIYNITNTLLWMPALYVAAFMLFTPRRAMLAAGGTFLLAAATLGTAAILSARLGDPRVPALLVNAMVAHLLILMLLSLVVLLRSEVERISTHARVMEDAAHTDPLTGIANRRAIEEWLQDWEGDTVRGSAALVLFDIDHFKTINDRHGHLVGDEILVSIAQLIRGQLRAHDIVGRWGGEEFLVVIEDANAMHALMLAERVRQLVTILVHPVAGMATISAGIAVALPGQPSAAAFRAADAALYAAKSAGRNRVVVN